MFSYWAYVLVGENNTGKTSFQRNIVNYLCNTQHTRLNANTKHSIVHPRTPKKLSTIFTCNRSYQEKSKTYKSVKNYFSQYFEDADICFLSSHANGKAINDIRKIQDELRARYYNVAAIFWSNSDNKNTQKIAALQWDEVFWIDNPPIEGKDEIGFQLNRISVEFANILIGRSHSN